MNIETTEYLELVDDDDLNVTDTYNSMIMYCEHCKYFFRQKACGCRTIFPMEYVFHPTDGNVVLFEQTNMDRRHDAYECEHHPIRVTSVAFLNSCINHANK